jgi:hypothetical protein
MEGEKAVWGDRVRVGRKRIRPHNLFAPDEKGRPFKKIMDEDSTSVEDQESASSSEDERSPPIRGKAVFSLHRGGGRSSNRDSPSTDPSSSSVDEDSIPHSRAMSHEPAHPAESDDDLLFKNPSYFNPNF